MTEPSSASHPHEADRIVPENKITGEQKIESAPRVGDDLNVRESGDKDSPDKGKEAKAEPDLRRHLCGDKPCEKLEPKPVESPEQELRHHPCVKEPCSCPPGQKTNDGGCVATVAQNQCPAGQIWNGLNCVPNGDECIAITGRAAHLIIELRDLRARLEEACAQNSSGQQCMDLTRQHTFVLEQYRVQWLQASPVCRGRLPDPITL